MPFVQRRYGNEHYSLLNRRAFRHLPRKELFRLASHRTCPKFPIPSVQLRHPVPHEGLCQFRNLWEVLPQAALKGPIEVT